MSHDSALDLRSASELRYRTRFEPRTRLATLLFAFALALCACGHSGGPPASGSIGDGATFELISVHYGRLVDVYGLERSASGTAMVLYESDVLIGSDIRDERDNGSSKRDDEILHDFLTPDLDTLQPRLLITRLVDGSEFRTAFAALGSNLRLVAPAKVGADTQKQPFTVVPRNGAIQLTFDRTLPIDDTFFVSRDAEGKVTGLLDTQAVQVLRIVGDPNDANSSGDFEIVPTRIAVKGNRLVLDPVLLGSEGVQFNTRNRASGLPEASDQVAANIRIALALAGPLRMQGLRPDSGSLLVGTNLSGVRCVIRDFRSGTHADSTSELSQGYVRETTPPRLLGLLPFRLEKVEERDALTQYLTLFKAGIRHELDAGDAVSIVAGNDRGSQVMTDILENPTQDQGRPEVQHVRVVVRRVARLAQADPRLLAGYPADPRSSAGEAWLEAHAPKAVIAAEFALDKGLDANQVPYGDDPAWFVTFAPTPQTVADGVPPNQNVSPFAAAIVRFTKPVDFATVRALDTLFFATRNVLDQTAIDQFIAEKGIDRNWFRLEKFITPHLVGARIFDEDGSQTTVRLQPPLGLYLDEAMRTSDEGVPFAAKKFRYFLHLVSGDSGIRDLPGNPIDLQTSAVSAPLVIPFSLDTRKSAAGKPLAPDNLVATVARRYGGDDEDEQPSLYRQDEVQLAGSPVNAKAYHLQDLFGAVVLLSDGSLQARPATRARKIVDDLNQIPPPSQDSPLRWCPSFVYNEAQVVSATAGTRFGLGVQNPLNPYGARMQTVWREIDMSLSRVDPFDMNLDVEQLYWAPFTESPIRYDSFDRMSLYLGHSEWRPEPCIGLGSALASIPDSGLGLTFATNLLGNQSLTGSREPGPAAVAAYVDRTLPIDSSLAFTEPNRVNNYLPLPKFDKPYFVWRDETVVEQGCNSQLSTDSTNNGANQNTRAMNPYIWSPFLAGLGRLVTRASSGLVFNQGYWNNLQNYWLEAPSRLDTATGGLVGAIAAPLLADFWVFPDSSNLPKGNPFLASGLNGWQISITVTSSPPQTPWPYFRAVSAGGLVNGKPQLVDPSSPAWATASGAYTPSGATTVARDNSLYWIMADFVKRQTVVTAGFVAIFDPHRMPPTVVDPRLGPYLADQPNGAWLPRFVHDFEPQLTELPGGTEVIPEFRGAGAVDTLSVPAGKAGMPWAAAHGGMHTNYPDEQNFPLDPLKAGDAHIRKFDDRKLNGVARMAWTYNYNRNVTRYTSDPNALMDTRFTSLFAGPNETFLPSDVKYFNWRFIMRNNVDAATPAAPKIQSFSVSYRFEKPQ